MLRRLAQLALGGGGLVRAEAEIASAGLRRSLMRAALAFFAIYIALIGGLAVIAGGAILLAREAGWPVALAATGALLVVLGVIALMLIRRGLAKAIDPDSKAKEARVKAAQAKQSIRDAANPASALRDDDTPGEAPDLGDLAASAAHFISKHPAGVAGAAFAVLSVVGPFRTLRLLGRAAAVASLAVSAFQSASRAADEDRPGTPPSPEPAPRPSPPAGASPPAARTLAPANSRINA